MTNVSQDTLLLYLELYLCHSRCDAKEFIRMPKVIAYKELDQFFHNSGIT